MNNVILKAYVTAKVKVEQILRDERGVTAIEYAIVGVAIAAIVAYMMGSGGPLSKALNDAMLKISDSINSVSATTP
jgi:pilus assembly protein Flp/PilA